MTACNYLYLFAISLLLLGWEMSAQAAESANGSSSDTTASSQTATASSTTHDKAAAHKSSHHRKKKTAVAEHETAVKKTASASTVSQEKKVSDENKPDSAKKKKVASTPSGAAGSTVATTSRKHSSRHRTHTEVSEAKSKLTPITVPSAPIPSPFPADTSHTAITPSQSGLPASSPIAITPPPSVTDLPGPSGPEVETGLPVARHGKASYQLANTLPITSVAGGYLGRVPAKTALDNFTFTNFSRRRNIYPWKTNIYTTIFWIGEGSTPISSTDNVNSAWEQDWRASNGGSDTPGDRDGYFPAHHAARQNPFYVALPFNDLAFPDKARRWLPASWYRSPRDGKPVSACKDRWVEIKNEQGDTCYAQWEDVGPLRYDHAEYVFGNDRPDTYTSAGLDRAGLDISPAVADYLNINGKNCFTHWRFVDDADVPAGTWLKCDEEALIVRAIHDLKQNQMPGLPIQRATVPIDDESDLDSNKKRLGAAKG